ncbi:MAG: hypothetical protein JSV43_01760, partial [Methanobacteriota archaeon]
RDNTADETDIGWFVVEFEHEKPAIVVGPEHSTGNVQITASIYHVRPDGTDPQEIVTSPITTIDSRTPSPLVMSIGSGPQLNFTDTDPRLLRLGIVVVDIVGGERFSLAYGIGNRSTNLETPANSTNIFYLHDDDVPGVIPAGKWMNGTLGANTERNIFDSPGQSAYWYHMLWSPPYVSITSPAQDQHVTGVVDVLYAMNPPVVSVLFEYHNGVTWTSLGYDLDLDGTFQWDSCSAVEGVVTLRATATDPLGYTGEDIVTGIEIDCTPPSIQILQPTDHSIIQGNVSISYIADADAVRVVLRYDDGVPHTLTTDTPPDGTAIWNVDGQTHSGTILRAIATDEVGLTSQTEVVGLSTPGPIIPVNIPPIISGVPDIIVHYDYSYNFDLTPYISDEDNSSDELTVTTSDIAHIWESPANNLGIVMNYPQSMLGQTVRVTIWVTDQIDTDYQVINVTVSDDYAPEKLRPLPDVSFDEDETKLNVFYTNLDYYFLDVDGDNLYYTSGNASVRIRINPNNTVDMWALPDWFGYEIITIRATDPTGALVEDVVIVQVNPVNDAPVIEEIPEIHLQGSEIRTVDLSDYIYDIDSPTESLSITVESDYITTSGLNLTLQFPNRIREEYLQITVSDGVDSTIGMVKIVVHLGQGDCLLLWLIILATLINVFVWGIFIVNQPRIYAGFLLKENGSLVKEMSLTRKHTVPYGIIRERIKAIGIEQKDRMDLDRYRLSLVRGERLQLAIVSSPHFSKHAIVKMEGSLQSLDTDEFDRILADGDEEKIDEHLVDFEKTFKRLSKGT